MEGQARSYIEGYRVTFIPCLGVKKLGSFHMDLAERGTTRKRSAAQTVLRDVLAR